MQSAASWLWVVTGKARSLLCSEGERREDPLYLGSDLMETSQRRILSWFWTVAF